MMLEKARLTQTLRTQRLVLTVKAITRPRANTKLICLGEVIKSAAERHPRIGRNANSAILVMQLVLLVALIGLKVKL